MYHQIGERYVITAIGNQSAHYPGKNLIGKECTLLYFEQCSDHLYAHVDIDNREIVCCDIVLLRAPKRLKEVPK